jgi:hypothetical protein
VAGGLTRPCPASLAACVGEGGPGVEHGRRGTGRIEYVQQHIEGPDGRGHALGLAEGQLQVAAGEAEAPPGQPVDQRRSGAKVAGRAEIDSA